MSLCLFQLIGKGIGIAFVFLCSSFGYEVKKELSVLENNIDNIGINPIVEVTEYETQKQYNKKLPYGTSNVLIEGKTELVFKTGGEDILLHSVQNEVIEVGTGPKGDYKGSITGYGADCAGCSGIVSCRTSDNKNYDLRLNENYDDMDYGDIRILAADLSLFQCGTIIEVTASDGETFMGVVMDTGIAMRNAWRGQGQILIDVAFKSERDNGLYSITDKTGEVTFNVKRWGW